MKRKHHNRVETDCSKSGSGYISRRKFVAALGALAAGAAIAPLGLAAQTLPQRPPNIILILADDLGYGDSTLYGCSRVKTPHIQSMADNGVTFSDGHVSCPLCSPSRAGLLTGRYQNRFGFEFNCGGVQRAKKQGLGLPPAEQTMADLLKKAGYATGMVGKWHLGSSPEFHPQNRGFDEFFGFLHGAQFFADPSEPGMKTEAAGTYRNWIFNNGVYERARKRNPIMRGSKPVEEAEYLTDAFTREAIDFIERKKDQPFFLYLPYNAPHTPLQAPPEYYDRFPEIKDEKQRIFAAMVSAVDDGVGAIVKKLRQTGLEENTLLVFLSDNGCAKGTGACSNEPLRQGKIWLFEGGTRVPLTMKWPRMLPAGLEYQQPVISLDLMTTFIKAAGADIPEKPQLDGVDLIPYLTGKEISSPHDWLFWRHGHSRSVRHQNWKLFFNNGHHWLFDLDADISERKNLFHLKPKMAQTLLNAHAEWESEMMPPLWPTRKEWTVQIDRREVILSI